MLWVRKAKSNILISSMPVDEEMLNAFELARDEMDADPIRYHT